MARFYRILSKVIGSPVYSAITTAMGSPSAFTEAFFAIQSFTASNQSLADGNTVTGVGEGGSPIESTGTFDQGKLYVRIGSPGSGFQTAAINNNRLKYTRTTPVSGTDFQLILEGSPRTLTQGDVIMCRMSMNGSPNSYAGISIVKDSDGQRIAEVGCYANYTYAYSITDTSTPLSDWIYNTNMTPGGGSPDNVYLALVIGGFRAGIISGDDTYNQMPNSTFEDGPYGALAFQKVGDDWDCVGVIPPEAGSDLTTITTRVGFHASTFTSEIDLDWMVITDGSAGIYSTQTFTNQPECCWINFGQYSNGYDTDLIEWDQYPVQSQGSPLTSATAYIRPGSPLTSLSIKNKALDAIQLTTDYPYVYSAPVPNSPLKDLHAIFKGDMDSHQTNYTNHGAYFRRRTGSPLTMIIHNANGYWDIQYIDTYESGAWTRRASNGRRFYQEEFRKKAYLNGTWMHVYEESNGFQYNDRLIMDYDLGSPSNNSHYNFYFISDNGNIGSGRRLRSLWQMPVRTALMTSKLETIRIKMDGA